MNLSQVMPVKVIVSPTLTSAALPQRRVRRSTRIENANCTTVLRRKATPAWSGLMKKKYPVIDPVNTIELASMIMK